MHALPKRKCACSVQYNDLLVPTTATLVARAIDDHDVVLARSLSGMGPAALAAGFLLDLESGCIAILGILVP